MKDNRKGEGDFLYKKRIIKEKLERIRRLAFFVQKYKDNAELIEDYSKEIEKISAQIESVVDEITGVNTYITKNEQKMTLNKKNILLAIPEGAKEKEIMSILQKIEVTVFWVTESRKALDAFIFSRSGTFDAILIDSELPNKNGFLTAKAIRSCEKKNAGCIPLIALLNEENKEEVRKARDAGMDGWLGQPFVEEEVMSVIFKFIQKVALDPGSQVM